MDFILDPTNYAPVGVCLGLTILFLGALLTAYASRLSGENDWVIALRLGLSLAAIVAFIATFISLVWNVEQTAIRQEAIVTEIQETYSVFPSERQMRGLEYPTEQPSGGFEEFGSFQRDNGEEAVLVWTGDEFQLGTMKGKRFVEFERVDG